MLGFAVALSVGLALVSLALPSAPGYDPWSWLIWGREVTSLDLSTSEGPAWKPLPVMVTAALAPLGHELAPAAWLAVARAGAVLAVLVAGRLAQRLAGGSAVAGLAAAFGILFVPGWIEHAAVGNAEGLLTALLLLGLAALLGGRLRTALALVAVAALVRAEVWPFLAVVGAAVWCRNLGTARVCLFRGATQLACSAVDQSPRSGLGPRQAVFVRNGLSPTQRHRVEVTDVSGRVELDGVVILR